MHRLDHDQVTELIHRYEAGVPGAILADRFEIAESSGIPLMHTQGTEMRPMHVTY